VSRIRSLTGRPSLLHAPDRRELRALSGPHPWLDPAAIIQRAGPWALLVVCFIVFAETGLLVGFLLPGDTLLVISGLLSHSTPLPARHLRHQRVVGRHCSSASRRSSAARSGISSGTRADPPSSSARNRACSAARTWSAPTRSSSGTAASPSSSPLRADRAHLRPVAAGVGHMPWRRTRSTT
jgi:membrane-associated protein